MTPEEALGVLAGAVIVAALLWALYVIWLRG